ncbi:imidazolonepropionase [candidate division WOR-3 bacterium]|nr:imidazolonepropionase [candidate division WOR-3 bacterium]
MEDLSILNASELITLNPIEGLGILKNASISIKGGKISNIGLPKLAKKEIDAKGKVVMPGFIDPHTHLIFGGSRANEFELRIKGKTYEEIANCGGGIINTVNATREASEKELFESAMGRLNYALCWGTTTMEVKSGYGLSLRDELKILKVIKKLNDAQPITLIPTFLGAHEIPPEKKKGEYIQELINEMIPKASKFAKFCDVFCEKGVFTKEEAKKILQCGLKFGLKPKIHADELSSSGGSELAGEIGAISADHVVYPSFQGIKLMKKAETIAVLLPGTCLFLGHKPSVKKLIDAGIPIAIGSDFNPGSSPILSMPIIIGLACILLKLTPAQAIIASTINSAYALGLGNRIGSLELGKDADIIILNVSSYKEIPYWFGFNPVQTVICRGEPACLP